MRNANSCMPHNLSDELYNVFKLQRKTALEENELTAIFQKQYGRVLHPNMLKQIPFIQIEKEQTNINNRIFYLVIELDDCCNQRNGCISRECKLLHFIDLKDKFSITYPQTSEITDKNISKHVNLSNRFERKTYIKVSPLELPDICFKQRIENILNESTSNPKQMTLHTMQAIHNKKYPKFKSHQPTLQGISIRFSKIFMIRFDEWLTDPMILFNQIIPCQLHKHYLSITISPQWTDQSLIPQLVQHIQQNTTINHIYDVYIKNVSRLGYFTTNHKLIVDKLIFSTKYPRNIKCCGRAIKASVVPNIQKNGYRVKIQNLPCTLSHNDFRDWLYKVTQTFFRKHLIYNIIILFSHNNIGSSQCIMLFNDKKDIQYIINQKQNMSFRGVPLQFKHWNHPYAYNQVNQVNQNIESTEHNNEEYDEYEEWDKYQFSNDPNLCKDSKANAVQNKFRDILKTVTKETFKNVYEETKYLINNEIETKQQMQDTISLILQFTLKNTKFMDEYVNLCICLFEHSSKIDPISIREMIVNQTYSLFMNSNNNKHYNKNNFFDVMELVGQLYNVGLFKINLIYKGVLKHLLPISETNIEGLCRLFIKCGKSLDGEDTNSLDKYLQILIKNRYNKYNDRIIALIDKTATILRNNKWIKTQALQQIYNELQGKYSEIFLKQQSVRKEMNQLMEEYKWMKKSEILKEKYNELEMNQEPTRMQMNILINQINQYKELQIKYDKLQKTTESETRIRKYISWDANDIVNWIVALDKYRYGKYYTHMRHHMINEGIDGKCLPKIDKNDLHRFGVTQFTDKCDIFNSIQQLINQSITCPVCKHSWHNE